MSPERTQEGLSRCPPSVPKLPAGAVRRFTPAPWILGGAAPVPLGARLASELGPDLGALTNGGLGYQSGKVPGPNDLGQGLAGVVSTGRF